ncbi:Hydrogenase nickel incorporation protein HypB [Geosporobacter subterraneus DSM 17957]|uniref:Hydrogenase nickel incorporation protein HypB n=1 Tax=Geosporobacter subterraneus DSM 17957 TaxID=1121919 RepID=A0A1M6D0I9_9FIRM|nr:hydrogenase nickel incorporation protein HypB [Geosporobacter subterraneus]SHI66498.1 Hydrogenase nickel incorporation protein HypB [Geosporobacter subterraneus DSM 17957]
MKQIQVKKNILQSNDDLAEKNRVILEEKGVFTINLLGSPGAGKTSVLEQLIGNMKASTGMAVIEGDLYTTKDAERIEAQGIPVIQVNTGGACHLDAAMISEALHHLDLEKIRFLVIENVGNLVCPASYDLSEDMRITVLSITEGNDKPLKYPSMFQRSDVLIVNKMDLIQFTNFSMEELYRDIRSLNEDMKIFEVSCRTGEGFYDLCRFLKQSAMNKGGQKDA